MTRRILLPATLMVVAALAACAAAPEVREYDMTGQVLAVDREAGQLTVRHDDIEGLMPAMTMSFAVEPVTLLDDRQPGELIAGVLEVSDSHSRLVAISHVGEAPLPVSANQIAMASGLLEVGDEVPDAAFIDQQDTRRAFAEWQGSLTVVTFIYTRCPLPDFCPRMDQHFAAIQAAVQADPALAGQVQLVSVTFDPDYDTPAVLADHAARLGADPAMWTFLTGEGATVERFAGRFGVGVAREADATEITHNLRTAVIDREGRILAIHSGGDWTPGLILDELRGAL